MSKEGRVRGGRGTGDKSAAGVPYSTITRREKSRKLAQKRRDNYKQIMEDMTSVMPFPKDVVAQLDYNSRLRLTICFFRMKTMLKSEKDDDELPLESVGEASGESTELRVEMAAPNNNTNMQVVRRERLFKPGMLQDLMCEALDGFLMVTQLDGTIIFLSESIHKHLGLFQSEHIGVNMYELILDDDHEDVRQRISEADDKSVKRKTKHGTTDVSFFCRMKCSRFKLANTVSKSPGFKLVYVSGTVKVAGDEPFLACTVRPVNPPTVLELRMEGNMFVAHYSMENMACIYFDGRLHHLLGYTKEDFIGKTPFQLQHHDDLEATMECSRQVQSQGKGVSGYYRFLNRFGEYIWIQSQAVVAFDGCSGRPSHIVCTSYVISKEDGNKDLLLRQAIASRQSEFIEKTLAPNNPLASKKLADNNKNGTHARLRNSENSPLLAKIKHKEQTNGHRLQTGSSDKLGDGSSNPNPSSSTSKGNKSSSLLYSMLSSGRLSPPKNGTTKSDNDRTRSHVSVSGSQADETAEDGSHSELTNRSPRVLSGETEEGYLNDSATVSSESSPRNPLSVQSSKSTRSINCGSRTTSGSDLGYHSGSNSSMREPPPSTFTGYDSETSSYMYDAGADSPLVSNPYSPDHPLSVLSCDGSITSHVSFITASPSESHSQSLFSNPSSVHSSVGSPTYTMSKEECEFGVGYAQRSPGNQSVNSEHSDVMSPAHNQGSEVNLQLWSPGSVASSSSQHHSSAYTTQTLNGENPGNYGGQRGLAYAKTDPTMMIANHATFNPRASPGSPYVNGSSSSMTNQYPTTTPSASLLLSDVFVTSVTDTSPLASVHGSAYTTNGTVKPSDLPLLTVEDLKVLDSFVPNNQKEEDQFVQLLYHQTALSCRGTMMM